MVPLVVLKKKEEQEQQKEQKERREEEDKMKKNRIAGVTTIVIFVGVVAASIVATTTMAPLTALGSRSVGGGEGFIDPTVDRKAPSVVTGDNIYIAWWTNNTENGNEEVMFRASNDGGATFGDKINLSNSTEADSWRVEIHGEGDNVVVSWWETNQTSDVSVARVSNDAGETFGPVLTLATNGTISSTEEEGEGEEGG
jgi:hypothetical protein